MRAPRVPSLVLDPLMRAVTAMNAEGLSAAIERKYNYTGTGPRR